jgi:uncharacterized membrane protein
MDPQPMDPAVSETGRIEAFSDGVFAIAITLLILGIQVPRATSLGPGGLARALLALWPHYLAFVTSFATIFAMWVNHHRIFTFIRTSDHALLYWNGLLLLLITFVPFPTTLLAEYLLHPEEKVAGILFAGTMAAIAVVFKGLWRHVAKDARHLQPGIPPHEILQVTRQHRNAPLLYLVAVAASFVSTALSAAICFCLAIYLGVRGWPVPNRRPITGPVDGPPAGTGMR